MADLSNAISEITGDQNEVSEFISTTPENPAQAQDAPDTQEKRPRGRPKGSGKNQKAAAVKKPVQKSFIPDTPQPTQDAAQGATVNPEQAEAAKSAADRDKAAYGATKLVETSGLMLAAEDGKMDKQEFSSVKECFYDYFEQKGIVDFPPGISLGLALGGYYARVLTAEKSRPKIAGLVYWFKSKMSFLRKQKTVAAENGA